MSGRRRVLQTDGDPVGNVGDRHVTEHNRHGRAAVWRERSGSGQGVVRLSVLNRDGGASRDTRLVRGLWMVATGVDAARVRGERLVDLGLIAEGLLPYRLR